MDFSEKKVWIITSVLEIDVTALLPSKLKVKKWIWLNSGKNCEVVSCLFILNNTRTSETEARIISLRSRESMCTGSFHIRDNHLCNALDTYWRFPKFVCSNHSKKNLDSTFLGVPTGTKQNIRSTAFARSNERIRKYVCDQRSPNVYKVSLYKLES